MSQAEKYLQELIDQNKAPCVLYHIFDKENIVYQFKGGFSDVGKKIKANTETTFNAFSVTKTFTAIAILQLAEQKKLDIEQSAKDYLPDFPYPSTITVRQLLTHSAGIQNPIPLNWIHLAGENSTIDRNQFFNKIFLKHSKTKSGPNEKFSFMTFRVGVLRRIKAAGRISHLTQNVVQDAFDSFFC